MLPARCTVPDVASLRALPACDSATIVLNYVCEAYRYLRGELLAGESACADTLAFIDVF